MRSNDAAKPPFSTVHQEEGEKCLFATKPWNHQRVEKGEKSRTRNLERPDYHAHLTNEVCLWSATERSNVDLIFFSSRPRTQDFIDQQLQIMTAMQEQQAREAEERKAKRQQQVYRREAIPPLPTS